MRTLAISALFVVAGLCDASTYYVAITGKDTNVGSSAKPWATLQHAVDAIAPGDTIFVRTGTYVGCRIGKPGTSDKPKALEVAPGAHVIVNAPGPDNKHDSIIEVENFSFTMTDWVIDGFEVENSPKYGIDVRVTNRITVTGNHVHNSTATGIFTAFSNYDVIRNNETDHNGEHGIYQSNSSTHPLIYENLSHDNVSCGIHMNGDISEQPGNGLVTYPVVVGNTIYNNGASGGSGINCDGVDYGLISNNLLYNNHASGISLYGIDGAHSSSNNRVYNNTIVMAANSRYVINIPDDGAVAPPVSNSVYNNILYTPDAAHGSILVVGPDVKGFSSDYNVVVNRFSDDNGNSNISLAAWRKLGYDKHSLIATPTQLFVNPATNNYRLKAGSPAIKAGLKLTAVPYDILGAIRTGSAWDIGCYAYTVNP